MEQFFPSASPLSPIHQKHKNLQGLDCSGLLYQATKSNTPRNTRQLLTFGQIVNIEGKTRDQIIPLLKPLDLIVRDGHVVILLDENKTIESRRRANFKGGIEIVPLSTRLDEILKTRKPVNDYNASPLAKSKKFVIRRRHPDML